MNILEKLHIDWKTLVVISLTLVSAIILTRVFRWLIVKTIEGDSLDINVDPTRYKFFKNAISLLIWMIAIGLIISEIPRLRNFALTLFAGAGILVAILGFAAQAAFANIVGGVFIVMFKPFRVGDMIKVGSLPYGIVEDITLRHTIITNFENKRIIIPNSVVNSETVINDSISDERVCRWIEFGISYDSDVDLATRIIQEESIKHPQCIDMRNAEQKKSKAPQVEVRLMSFGDFSVNLRAYVWLRDPLQAIRTHSDINKAVKKRFDAEGIEIPFPYRTIVYKNDLPPNAKSNDV
ncbi:MAG: mechanosensitive ion channel family protein [Vicingaceae bacterium]